MTHRIEMPKIRPDRRSSVRIVPVSDLRTLHRLLVLMLLLQMVNLIWQAVG